MGEVANAPILSEEGRAEALRKSREMRHERMLLVRSMKRGEVSFLDVMERTDEVVTRMRVHQLLKGIPGIGKTYSKEAMDEAGIKESRKVGGLGRRQREALLAWYKRYAELNLES